MPTYCHCLSIPTGLNYRSTICISKAHFKSAVLDENFKKRKEKSSNATRVADCVCFRSLPLPTAVQSAYMDKGVMGLVTWDIDLPTGCVRKVSNICSPSRSENCSRRCC